jgi:ppGpp synthetase/RelA/SpoT-type nucleotidyltranferase
MATPISRTQLKNLTRRLRDGTETPDDLHALADVLIYYRQVLERAHAEVVRVCAETQHAEPMAPRVKTLKTTMEKLHRQSGLHSLAQIRDLAGLRVVVHGTRTDQDELAARICAVLPDGGRPAKLIDRRADPRSGYRAVHLEVKREGILLEVQVRTELQHRWAELYERTADRLGRGLRYGEQVPLPVRAATFLDELAALSELIDRLERDGTPIHSDTHHTIRQLLDHTANYLEQLP